jgi:hypothetical protein
MFWVANEHTLKNELIDHVSVFSISLEIVVLDKFIYTLYTVYSLWSVYTFHFWNFIFKIDRYELWYIAKRQKMLAIQICHQILIHLSCSSSQGLYMKKLVFLLCSEFSKFKHVIPNLQIFDEKIKFSLV